MRYLKAVKISEIDRSTAPTNKEQQESLGLRGMRQPIRLWEYPLDTSEYKYRVVDGRRRIEDWIALKQKEYQAGMSIDAVDTVEIVSLAEDKILIGALVYNYDELDEENMHLDALTLNSGKNNYMDEADHISYLMTEETYTVEDVASSVNLSISTVLNRLDLIHKLIFEYQDKLRDGGIKVSAAHELVKISKESQIELYWQELMKTSAIKKAVKKIRDSNRSIGSETIVAAPLDEKSNEEDVKIYHNGEAVNEAAKLGSGLFLPYEEIINLIENQGGMITYAGVTYQVDLKIWHPEYALPLLPPQN